MIWLALDPGTRRIGVAVSDDTEVFAHPLTTLSVSKKGGFPLAELAALVVEREVGGIVVGWPCRLDGTVGPEAVAAEALADYLRAEFPVVVELWDERLTSVEAERLLIEAGVRRNKRKGATDRIAAALILQGFLEHRAEGLADVVPSLEP